MPGLPVKPGTVTPSGPALSKARVLLGEQVMRRIFEIDAARSDANLGIRAAWHGMETDLPGARALVDGRAVTDPGHWTGIPRRVLGIGPS